MCELFFEVWARVNAAWESSQRCAPPVEFPSEASSFILRLFRSCAFDTFLPARDGSVVQGEMLRGVSDQRRAYFYFPPYGPTASRARYVSSRVEPPHIAARGVTHGPCPMRDSERCLIPVSFFGPRGSTRVAHARAFPGLSSHFLPRDFFPSLFKSPRSSRK